LNRASCIFQVRCALFYFGSNPSCVGAGTLGECPKEEIKEDNGELAREKLEAVRRSKGIIAKKNAHMGTDTPSSN